MTDPAHLLLWPNLFAHGAMLLGVVWCIARPSRRIYPMERKSVTYYAMWVLFSYIFLSNTAIVVLDWNSGPWSSWLRFFVGGPILGVGIAFLLWGISTLGSKNTSGLQDGFVARGPYLISRNPQYVGDFFIFAGFAVLANSELVLVVNVLSSLIFLLAPAAEEPWLAEQYCDEYIAYRSRVPRFL